MKCPSLSPASTLTLENDISQRMPPTADDDHGASKPYEGIKIASLLHLAAINRENERSHTLRTHAKAAPLKEVLNQPEPDRRLVPLSLIAPQYSENDQVSSGSLLSVLDADTTKLSAPLHSVNANLHEGTHSAPQVRLPGVEDITKRPPKPGKAGVPLAEVLNEESRSPHLGAAQPSSRRSSVSSGNSRKRRKLSSLAPSANAEQTVLQTSDNVAAATSAAATRQHQNQGITLPKLPDTNPREQKRHRLPPVITGLHDPPEEARLIPSITTDNSTWHSRHDPASPGGKASHEATVVLEATANSSIAELEQIDGRSRSPVEAEDPLEAPEAAGGIHERHNLTHEQAPKKERKTKLYKRWTTEEHQCLIDGIDKYGIGNWKQMLDDDQFNFHPDRTAVDLKDRFRRCFPKEYRESGKSALDQRQMAFTEPYNNRNQGPPAAGEGQAGQSSAASTVPDKRVGSSRAQPASFRRVARRGRVKFTEDEDEALRRGFERHGTNWQKILTDAENETVLAGRSRTDLRDRFRNKWPEKFKSAKANAVIADLGEIAVENVEGVADEADSTNVTFALDDITAVLVERHGQEGSATTTLPTSTDNAVTSTDHLSNPAPSSQYPILSNPLPLLDDLDLRDIDIGQSHPFAAAGITLSRHIVDWADRNAPHQGLVPLSVPSFSTSVTASIAHPSFGSVGYNQSMLDRSALTQATFATALTGMPLSSMLTSDEVANGLLDAAAASRGATSIAVPQSILPSADELGLPFEHDQRLDSLW